MTAYRIVILTVISIVFFACGNKSGETTTGINADSTFVEKERDIAITSQKVVLDSVLNLRQINKQFFSVHSNSQQQVHTEKGMKITIVPNDLETENGTPLAGDIQVTVKEMYDKDALVREHAQTVSDGRLLVSGGAFFIGMSSGGTPLKLKSGKKLNIQMPKPVGEMSLFYGQRDANGIMNWKQAPALGKDSSMNEDEFDSVVIPEKKYITDEDYATVQHTKTMSAKDFNNANSLADIMGVTEHTDSPTKKIVKNLFKSKKIIANALAITELGWINIDKYYNNELEPIEYTINSADGIQFVDVFILYKDLNAMMENSFYPEKNELHTAIGPRGKAGVLIAIGVKEGALYSSRSEIVFNKGAKYVLTWAKSSQSDINSLFKI